MLTISSSCLRIAKLRLLWWGTASLSNTKQINLLCVSLSHETHKYSTTINTLLNGRLVSEVSLRCYGKFAHFSFLSLLITLCYDSCWPALATGVTCAQQFPHHLRLECFHGVGVALLQYQLPVAELLYSLDANSHSPQLQHSLFFSEVELRKCLRYLFFMANMKEQNSWLCLEIKSLGNLCRQSGDDGFKWYATTDDRMKLKSINFGQNVNFSLISDDGGAILNFTPHVTHFSPAYYIYLWMKNLLY